jgi:hypothetical protein
VSDERHRSHSLGPPARQHAAKGLDLVDVLELASVPRGAIRRKLARAKPTKADDLAENVGLRSRGITPACARWVG